MGTIGMRFLSISGKVKKQVKNKISVGSSPVIEDVEERKTGLPGLDKILAIKFAFKTKYDPDVAEIELKGELMYQTKEYEKVLKEWKKNKKLISEELQLPPPVRFPRVTTKEKS
ncbi:MAG: hypothetical protein B6U68_03545 [Candidatus Aenigmarchaeota archaeon ex4484_14]|nr:MAG: hypothetical protein B6U68_03545 [Candidatus Aenigmarchaeota archaeon ex4484_14]